MMDVGNFIAIGRSSILEILTLASPVLIAAITVGFVISILQAVTSIQEQTLTFVPKIIAILLILVFLGPWMMGQMLNYTQNLWGVMFRV